MNIKKREVVSEDFLRDLLLGRMVRDLNLKKIDFWMRPASRKREGDGPNWRYEFNPGAVPAGCAALWERIRHEYEDRYDLADTANPKWIG